MNTTKNKKSFTKVLGAYSFILIWACILAAYLIINAGATTFNGVMNILRHSAVVGIMAFGMGLVIITSGIDLSVGSMLSLIGGAGVTVFNSTNSIFFTLLAVLLVGAILGFINGFLIGKVKMPPFIVTLATMLIYRSLAQYYLRTLRLSIYNMEGTLSAYDPFYSFGQMKVAGFLPMAGLILILVTVDAGTPRSPSIHTVPVCLCWCLGNHLHSPRDEQDFLDSLAVSIISLSPRGYFTHLWSTQATSLASW